MNRFFTSRRVLALVGMCFVIAALAGCSKRVTSVDAGRTTIEGKPNANAQLVTWSESAIPTYYLGDFATPAEFGDDFLVRSEDIPGAVSGRIDGQILDGTAATSYQMFERDPNGGFRPLLDYAVQPALRWTDQQWEMYSFVDSKTSGATGYIGRGMIDQQVGSNSPLTNASSTNTTFERTLTFAALRDQPDSVLTFAWSSDDRAAGYWLQVFPLGNLTKFEVSSFEANAPMPVIQRLGPYSNLIAYVPAPSGGGETGATVAVRATPTGVISSTGDIKLLTSHIFLRKSFYLARVIAVDASGNAINSLQCDYRKLNTDETLLRNGVDSAIYKLDPLGGVLVGSGIALTGFFGFNLQHYN